MNTRAIAAAGLLAATLSSGSPLRAQSPPPVLGTLALEGTMKKLYRAANIIIVKTIDGVEHAFTFTENLLVHGGKRPGIDALEGLQEGRTIVVHYSVSGTREMAAEIDQVSDEGLRISEGTVVRISRSRREIVIRFANGVTETLRLTERAAAAGAAPVDRTAVGVKIFYADENGQKVVHYFELVASHAPEK